jgi:hypothetical protein
MRNTGALSLGTLLLTMACTDAPPAAPRAVLDEAHVSARVIGLESDTVWAVLFKRNSVADVPGRAAALVAERQGGLIAALPGLQGFIARLSHDGARDLARRPEIALIEADRTLHFAGHSTQTNAVFGLDRLDQRGGILNGQYQYVSTGAGATIWIVDTGVKPDENDLSTLRFSALLSESFVASDPLTDCASNPLGHGTGVASAAAGALYGVAKQAGVVSIQVGCDSVGLTQAAQAMNHIRTNLLPRSVVNLSWGTCGGGPGEEPPHLCQGCPGDPVLPGCPPPSAYVDSIVRRVADAGATVIMAAGNRSTNACQSSPGRLRQSRSDLLVVGASNAGDQRWSHPTLGHLWGTNVGQCVDMFAPGAAVTLLTKSGSSATFTGTSFAAPYTAGAAALLLSAEPNLSSQQVADRLRSQATLGVLTGVEGSPNRLLYTLPRVSASLTQQPQWLTLPPNTNVTFTAHPSGGTSHYTYQWSSRFHWYYGYVEGWIDHGSAATQQLVVPGYTGSFEVRVVTTSGTDQHEATRMIQVDCSGTICAYSTPAPVR